MKGGRYLGEFRNVHFWTLTGYSAKVIQCFYKRSFHLLIIENQEIFLISGFHKHKRIQVFDPDLFFSDKSLCILNTNSLAQHPGSCNYAVQEIGSGYISLETFAAGIRGMELRGISFNCFHPLLKYIADIDKQVGFMIRVLQILEVILWTLFV